MVAMCEQRSKVARWHAHPENLAAHRGSPAAFDWCCIRPDCIVPQSNTPTCSLFMPSLALIATLGAARGFHRGMLEFLADRGIVEKGE